MGFRFRWDRRKFDFTGFTHPFGGFTHPLPSRDENEASDWMMLTLLFSSDWLDFEGCNGGSGVLRRPRFFGSGIVRGPIILFCFMSFLPRDELAPSTGTYNRPLMQTQKGFLPPESTGLL